MSREPIFLVVRFQRNRYSSILQLWNLESRELIQTINNLPLLTVNGLAIRSDREILACGMRDDKVSVWELRSDRILSS
jgi:hypothetical protein